MKHRGRGIGGLSDTYSCRVEVRRVRHTQLTHHSDGRTHKLMFLGKKTEPPKSVPPKSIPPSRCRCFLPLAGIEKAHLIQGKRINGKPGEYAVGRGECSCAIMRAVRTFKYPPAVDHPPRLTGWAGGGGRLRGWGCGGCCAGSGGWGQATNQLRDRETAKKSCVKKKIRKCGDFPNL